LFKTVNGLQGPAHKSKFKYISQLNLLYKEKDVTIVFLDDFICTGEQAIDCWNNIKSVMPQNAEAILAVVAAFQQGVDNIQDNTDLKVTFHKILDEKDRLLSDKNRKFTKGEKKILKKYCKKTGLSEPFGYKDSQACIVFHYKTPNNSVSILTANNSKWKGLFPRYPGNENQ
jgi:hypothetical protein